MFHNKNLNANDIFCNVEVAFKPPFWKEEMYPTRCRTSFFYFEPTLLDNFCARKQNLKHIRFNYTYKCILHTFPDSLLSQFSHVICVKYFLVGFSLKESSMR